MITNPAPAQIASGEWDVEPGINKFTVSIPTRPDDNDLAGIIVLAKEGTGQTLTFPDDIFYRGPWSDMIVVDTDDDNQALLPNQAYTVAVAAFDEFGTDSLTFSATKNVTTAQVQTNDIANSAVTNAKIDSVVADKITAGTITGSTLQTAATGKRFVVSQANNEAYFYGDRGDGTVELLATIGNIEISLSNYSVADFGTVNTLGYALRAYSKSVYGTATFSNYATTGGTKVEVLQLANLGSGDKKYGLDSLVGINAAGDSDCIGVIGAVLKSTSDVLTGARNYGVVGQIASDISGAGVYGKGISTDSKTAPALLTNAASDLSGGVVYFKSYTTSNLPSASTAGGMIYVSNESGGAVMAFSDGTNWRRVTDRAIVS